MIALVVVVLLAAPSEVVSRAHFVKAQKAFAQHEWKRALDEFTAASEAAPTELPDLYFDIAQCHRNLGHARSAVVAFERYLVLKPDAADKTKVRALIVQLGGKPPEDPPPPVAAVEPEVAPPPPQSSASVATPPSPTTTTVSLTLAPAAQPAIVPTPNAAPVQKRKRRWPIWVGVAGGLALGAIAVGVGVGVTSSSGHTTPPTPMLGSAATFDTRPH